MDREKENRKRKYLYTQTHTHALGPPSLAYTQTHLFHVSRIYTDVLSVNHPNCQTFSRTVYLLFSHIHKIDIILHYL